MKRSRIIWIGALLGVVLVVAVLARSFGARSSSSTVSQAIAPGLNSSTSEGGMAAPMPTAAPAAGNVALDRAALYNPANEAELPTDQQGFSRLVIKTADVSLQVADVSQAEALVRAKVSELGGYVVQVQTSGADNNLISSVTFRVPADRFEAALAGVEGLAKKVLSRTVGGDDVTEEFVDLDSRLRNLEATRERLLVLLQKADKVEDALAVNQSLSDVQGQIEQIKGRMQYLKQSAAFSTVTVTLMPVPPLPSVVPEEGWQPLAVARAALRGLIEFGQGLAEVIIVLVVWSPVWGVVLLVGVWAWRKLRSTRSREHSASSAS